ncbi:MAG: murein hydrolase activator EnvC family protein [Actinomycetota bacterium]
MRLRLDRGLLAAILVGTLIVPAVGTLAGPKEELEKTEAKLDEIQHRIDRDKAKASTIREKVKLLNEALIELQMEVAKLDRQVEEVEYEVRNAQARIDATQEEIDVIADEANEQAVMLYKTGSFETISALLNSESLAELDERIEMLGLAAQENTGALIKYGRLQLKIRAQKQDLFDKKDQLSETLKQRSRFLEAQAERKQELAEAYQELRANLIKNRDKENLLQSEMNEIQQALLEHQAKASVEALGTSGKGFIWPLNGPVTSYYGPRWGRMHTGIDIDGYTGQPIVSAKEGVVVLARYYSGYGNAVIVDHGGGYATLYAHMTEIGVSEGESIDQGEMVGTVGATGNVTGDHLHFEVRVNGEPVDPMPYLP